MGTALDFLKLVWHKSGPQLWSQVWSQSGHLLIERLGACSINKSILLSMATVAIPAQDKRCEVVIVDQASSALPFVGKNCYADAVVGNLDRGGIL